MQPFQSRADYDTKHVNRSVVHMHPRAFLQYLLENTREPRLYFFLTRHKASAVLQSPSPITPYSGTVTIIYLYQRNVDLHTILVQFQQLRTSCNYML